MEGGDGMVAVVRGIRDAGLAVTLLDGTRQYTLLPNPVAQQKPQTQVHITHVDGPSQRCTASNTGCERVVVAHCDSAAQATDGQYASMYKMAHCNVTPTAPPVQLTEFPPQRAELCRGHGNFEVGGCGSGESYSPVRSTGTYRGGMTWTDRGSVCAPKPSHEPDAFANSLRRYPTVSPDRSEVVERLISYTQARNSSKTYQTRTQTSPTRLPEASNLVDQSTRASPRCQRSYEHEVNVRTRSKIDESPTRDGKPRRECESSDYRRPVLTKSYDVRYLREVSRRFKDTLRISSYPYNHPVCPIMKERYDHLPPVVKHLPEQTSTNSVNMETQAAVEMVTREASTIPRKEPSKRTVAVPLSPTASTALQDTEGECLETTYKSVHTSFSPLNLSKSLKRLKSVQTCSSIDLVNKERVEDDRRTKSQEELRTNGLESEIVRLLEEVELYSYLSPKDKILRDELMKRFNKNGCSFKSDNKAGRSCSSDYEYCDKCSNGFVATQKDGKFKNDINSHKSDFLYSVISEWVNDMPIKNKDFLGRHMDKESVLNTIAKKLKCFMLNFEGNRLKSKIFDYVNEIPIEVHIENKGAYLNRQIDTLLRKARLGFNNRRKGDKKIFNFRKYVQPTESELREYVKYELGNFFDKSHIKINGKRLKELEIELVDVLMDSWDILDNNEELRDEIVYIMMELGRLSYQQAVSYTNVLIRNLKDFFVVDDNIRKKNMFIVLQSSCPNSSRQMNSKDSSDFSISGINEKDLETNLDFYMNRLTQQIDEWLTNLGIHEENKSLRQVVVNDLASDIVDRHKYLELNPSSQGTDEEELEHLRYQIFKWINKLVGEENTNTIEHASDLMKRIQSISAPMLTRFGQSNNTNLPACCQEGSKTHAKSGSNVSSQISPKVTSQGGVQTRNVCPGTMNISQMPMFGPLGLGGSMTESLPRPVSANRRYTSPGGYNAGHFTPDYKNLNINPLPMCSSPTVGDFTMESYTRPGSPGRRHSGSGGYNSGYMRPDCNNMNISNMPIFGPTGPGGSMIENPIRYTAERRLSSPGGFTPGLMKTGCPSYQDNMTIDGQSQLIGSRIPLIPETCGASIIPAANVCGGEYSTNLSQVSMFDPRRRMTSTPKNQKMDYQKVFNGPHTYEPQQIQVGSYGMSNATIGGSQNVGYSSPHSSRKPTCCQGVANVGQTIKDQKPGPSGTTQSLSPACCPSKYNSLKPSMHEIEKDFDTYLKQWVKKVPITDASPEEVAQIQELLINNVYKIIAIVKCNPEVLNNSVLYEDLLEEQIDALFEQLSTSSEFMDKNHALKIELIEKITEIEKEIKKSVQASSYRGQLVENIKNNMPGSNKVYDKHDYYSEFNDVKERGDIADNFVLQMYFNDDKVKSNVYKMRVSKGIQDMVKDISESQNFTVNVNATLNSLQGALYNVPIPPEEELKVEANHILLSQEVDQWLTDLPISEPDKIVAAHQRRTLRDGIVRKIYEIESKNIDNCMVERELKEEVLKVIERVPMSSKDININFMVDELINRLKNRPKEVPRRKSVSFNESIINYEDFGRSGMICSSYNDNLNVSYYKVGDERRELGYSPVEQPTPSRYLLPQVGRQIPQLDHNTTEFYTMKVSSVPAHQTYPQTMANQINNTGQGICCNMSQAQQVSAQSCAPANAGTSQQIPCRQPMAQSYQQEAMPDQSLYIPITQSPHANISQAQEISTQPGFLPASPARAKHTTCGQPMLTIQQNQSTPHQSMHVSMPQEPYGNMSQNQQISAQPYRPGSPGSAQQITCGQPMISQLQGQTNGAVPIGNINGSQVLQRSPIQQGAPSSCNVSQQGFHHQTGPLPGPSVFGNTMQVQNPVPASSSGLHTSQIAGPSRMLPSQNLQNPSTFTRSGVTQSSQMAEFGPDPRFLQPGGAQGTATQVTGSEFSTDPVANSTPQRQLQGGAAPPRVAKKRTREIDRDRLEHAARRVDLELSDEEEEDECNCLEKLWRHRRRRPMFFPCDDYDDYAGCYPMRYPFPFFY